MLDATHTKPCRFVLFWVESGMTSREHAEWMSAVYALRG